MKGILDYCNYETEDGYHGKLSSIVTNIKFRYIAKINNGYRTFEFDDNIELPSLFVIMSSFRFSLIGGND